MSDDLDFCPYCGHAQLPPTGVRLSMGYVQRGFAKKYISLPGQNDVNCEECGEVFESPDRWVRQSPVAGCIVFGLVLTPFVIVAFLVVAVVLLAWLAH